MNRSNGRGGKPESKDSNGMMLAEIKHLKAQLALKDKLIKEQAEKIAALTPKTEPVVTKKPELAA